MAPVLEIKGLKTYFNLGDEIGKAVDDVSLVIEKGETFALVGESGCGKSLTALSITKLIPTPPGYIAGGEVLLSGVNTLTLSEGELRKIRGSSVSMIFQEPMSSLNPVFTVGEQIAEAVRTHQAKNKAEAKELTIEMLKKVKLGDAERLYNEYPHRLSGGMRQRVMIAMALACRPKLLIADEPTTALDVTIQKEILTLIDELKEELGTAVLFITHNLALVKEYADKLGVMYAGKIVEQGATENIFKTPLHPYTKKLIDAVPTLKGRFKPLSTIPGTVPLSSEYATGCRFSGRCTEEMLGCSAKEPLLLPYKNTGHVTACHLFDEKFLGDDKDSKILKPKTTETHDLISSDKDSSEIILNVRSLKCYFPIKKGILKRTIGHVKAVDGIDLTIRRGKTTALVGESGCGKTTAGKTILRLIESSGGSIMINGEEISSFRQNKLREVRQKMQIIFQDPYSSLNPRQRVGEIIIEGINSLLPELSETDRKNKVTEALTSVGLSTNMANRYPHEFSGGQRQRISIARALAVEPELLICDEATSALDVSVQAQILNLIKGLQKRLSLGLLFITHDLGVVEYMADEVAIMKDGKIIESGATDKIFSEPEHMYTKTLLDSVPRL